MSAVFPLGPAVRAALPCCVCWINKFVGHTKTFRFNFFSCNILPTYMRRGSGVKGATSCQLLSSLHPFKRKFSMRVRNLYLKLRYTIYSMNRLLVYLQGGTISNAISLTFCLCLCQCAENILTLYFATIRNVVWSWMHATTGNVSAFRIGGFINMKTVMKWENWWNRRRINEKGHRGSRTNTSSQQWHSTSLFYFSSSLLVLVRSLYTGWLPNTIIRESQRKETERGEGGHSKLVTWEILYLICTNLIGRNFIFVFRLDLVNFPWIMRASVAT